MVSDGSRLDQHYLLQSCIAGSNKLPSLYTSIVTTCMSYSAVLEDITIWKVWAISVFSCMDSLRFHLFTYSWLVYWFLERKGPSTLDGLYDGAYIKTFPDLQSSYGLSTSDFYKFKQVDHLTKNSVLRQCSIPSQALSCLSFPLNQKTKYLGFFLTYLQITICSSKHLIFLSGK